MLGYGIDIEDIVQCMWHRPLGVKGLTWYIYSFVVNYGVAVVLLEGKLERLTKAIELVKQ